MPNPWILLAFVLALIATGLGGEFDGNKRGANAERVAWQAKDNAELANANASILQLETLARASEQSHSVAQAAISTTYQKDLQNAEIRRQKDIAAARTGALRLFDPGAQGACAGGASQDATSAGGRDGGPDTGLSSQSVEFLLTEADRADGIARQLGACQAVIVSDRVP